MFAKLPVDGSMMKIGRSFEIVSLLIGEISFGAVALRFEPSGAFANGFAGEGAGASGVDTEHASVVASTHTALQIVTDFSITFSRVRGRPRRTAAIARCVVPEKRCYLQPAPSHVVDPRTIHCQGRSRSPRSTVRSYSRLGLPVGRYRRGRSVLALVR